MQYLFPRISPYRLEIRDAVSETLLHTHNTAFIPDFGGSTNGPKWHASSDASVVASLPVGGGTTAGVYFAESGAWLPLTLSNTARTVAVSADGSLVAFGSLAVAVYSLPDGDLVSEFSLPQAASALAFSPDGSELYIIRGAAGSNTTGGLRRVAIPGGGTIDDVAWGDYGARFSSLGVSEGYVVNGIGSPWTLQVRSRNLALLADVPIGVTEYQHLWPLPGGDFLIPMGNSGACVFSPGSLDFSDVVEQWVGVKQVFNGQGVLRRTGNEHTVVELPGRSVVKVMPSIGNNDMALAGPPAAPPVTPPFWTNFRSAYEIIDTGPGPTPPAGFDSTYYLSYHPDSGGTAMFEFNSGIPRLEIAPSTTVGAGGTVKKSPASPFAIVGGTTFSQRLVNATVIPPEVTPVEQSFVEQCSIVGNFLIEWSGSTLNKRALPDRTLVSSVGTTSSFPYQAIAYDEGDIGVVYGARSQFVDLNNFTWQVYRYDVGAETGTLLFTASAQTTSIRDLQVSADGTLLAITSNVVHVRTVATGATVTRTLPDSNYVPAVITPTYMIINETLGGGIYTSALFEGAWGELTLVPGDGAWAARAINADGTMLLVATDDDVRVVSLPGFVLLGSSGTGWDLSAGSKRPVWIGVTPT